MRQVNRLPAGGRIDRTRPMTFSFDAAPLEGYAGDTLASALLANGVGLVARSFKYHRPRGIMTAGPEEPNALVRLAAGARAEPNTRATQIELYDGLVAGSQNCWPSVGFDIGALGSALARFLPAGFYYKTFMWPASRWLTYERFIRRAAGLGTAPAEPDPDRYEHCYAYCDVLVAGGGGAGLAAALAAARTGARVILADEQPEFGGRLLGDADALHIADAPAMAWVDRTLRELEALPEVTLLPRTTVVGYYDYNYLTALERVTDHLSPGKCAPRPRQRLWKVRARRVVLATGAIERPLVFACNDRPGVMLAGAVSTYINRFAVLPGRDVVVFTNNDSAYRTALDAKRAGASVQIVDLRASVSGPPVHAARESGIPVHPGAAVTGVLGRKAIRSVAVARLSDDGAALAERPREVPCSLLAVSGGWTPSVHLHSQARGALRYDASIAGFVPEPDDGINPHLSVGACAGTRSLWSCLRDGLAAGAAAAAAAGFGDGCAGPVPEASRLAEGPLRSLWTVPTVAPVGAGPRQHFHDLQNDVTAADIHLAAREGYLSVEHLKRYTTTGMGTDQGKTANLNALAIMAKLRDVPIEAVGTTTFRPPYTPITFGAIAGQNRSGLFAPRRKMPMHPWHESHGAVFECVGDWLRPWAFPKPGEHRDAAVQRECKAVRCAVGLFDASTLGKINIEGPDAAVLLNRVYTNEWSRLPVGRCRYGLMLNDRGMVLDDGVTTRLGEHHYHMTTTSGGAARVMAWLEEWLQTEWPDLKVYLTSVTEQWAVAVLSGPSARDLLQGLTELDLDGTRFPFMSCQKAMVAGVPGRIFRVSFSGELSYEINVPARYGLHMWRALVERGQAHGLCVYGTEALHVLRAERGFIVVGQDTDGTVTPMDLDMDWIVAKTKGDFIGRRSFACEELRRAGRKQLVGVLTADPHHVLPQGVHLVEEPRPRPPMRTLGHVTSSYMSPNLGRSIALALVEDGRRRIGETLKACTSDGRVEPVKLTVPVFFDPEGTRARG